MVLALCDRWHKLPSEVLAEGPEMLRLLTIHHHGHRPTEGGDDVWPA